MPSVAIEDEYSIKVLHDPKSPVVEYVSIHAFSNDALKNLIHMIVSSSSCKPIILMARLYRPNSRDDFEIAIICALSIERNAVEALLDEEYETDGFSYGKAAGDSNAYTTGRLGNQHVVLAYIPGIGMISTAAVASNIRSSFVRIKVGKVVGVCEGVPRTADGVEILLGDVVISTSMIQIDFGQQYPNKFIRKDGVQDTLGRANPEIRAFEEKASGKENSKKNLHFSAQIYAKDGIYNSTYPGPESDKPYLSDYQHKHQKRDSCIICGDSQKQDDEVCEFALQSSCAELGCDDRLLVERNCIQKVMGLSPDGRPITITSKIGEKQKASIHFGCMVDTQILSTILLPAAESRHLSAITRSSVYFLLDLVENHMVNAD